MYREFFWFSKTFRISMNFSQKFQSRKLTCLSFMMFWIFKEIRQEFSGRNLMGTEAFLFSKGTNLQYECHSILENTLFYIGLSLIEQNT